jgi:replicative DNA helicase
MDPPLPSAPDLERYVLGAILVEPERLESIPLSPDDFSVDVHRRIWREIVACARFANTPLRLSSKTLGKAAWVRICF